MHHFRYVFYLHLAKKTLASSVVHTIKNIRVQSRIYGLAVDSIQALLLWQSLKIKNADTPKKCLYLTQNLSTFVSENIYTKECREWNAHECVLIILSKIFE